MGIYINFMKNYSARNVDEFIASAPQEAQPKLHELRTLIKSTVPDATESISWGIPFYKYYGLLAGFTALKNHVDFGLAFQIDDQVRQNLKEQGYDSGKKTIKILFDQPIPTVIIKQILSARAKANHTQKSS